MDLFTATGIAPIGTAAPTLHDAHTVAAELVVVLWLTVVLVIVLIAVVVLIIGGCAGCACLVTGPIVVGFVSLFHFPS